MKADTAKAETKREMFAAMVETAISNFFKYDHLATGVVLTDDIKTNLTTEHRDKWLRKYDAAPDDQP